MLSWQVWNQAKTLNVRPSILYGVENPLAAFYLDRGIYWWGSYVEGKMDEAEAQVRKSMKNHRGGVEPFVVSARINVYNKLFGLSPTSAYRQVGPLPSGENSDGNVDLSVFNKKEPK